MSCKNIIVADDLQLNIYYYNTVGYASESEGNDYRLYNNYYSLLSSYYRHNQVMKKFPLLRVTVACFVMFSSIFSESHCMLDYILM